MDARWWSLYGHRAENLKKPDLPNLAKAIVAYMRRLDIQAFAGSVRNTSYIGFMGQKGSFNVVVRGDDWQKILPYLQSDQLNPNGFPFLPWGSGAANLSNIDVFDAQYYNRVLGVLNSLFPQDYPTSYL